MATTHEEHTTSDEDEIGVATETTRQDDNHRGVYEDEDRTVEIEMTKDDAKDEKASLNEEIKNETLNNGPSLNNHTEMNTGIASSHTAVLQKLQTRLQELGSDKDGEILALIERLNEEHRKEIETVQKISDKFLKEDGEHESEEMSKFLPENEVHFLKSKHKEEMEELRRTLDDEYQKQVLKISDELRDHYQNDINEKITKLEEEWELEFIKQKREFDERVTAVQKEQWSQCHDAIERVTLDAEDQLKNMKHAYDSETAEQKRRIQELLEERELFEMKEKEFDEEKCQKENESFEKIKTLEKQLSNEREEVEYQINGAQNEIQKIKNEHRKEIGNLKTELEKKYSNILNETRNEMKEKYQKELDEKVQRVKSHLQEQYEQHLEKTKEELRESSITLKTKYEKQLCEVLSQLEELHERNQQHELQEAKLKKDYETEKKKVEELEKDVEKKWEDIQQLAEKTKDHDLETQTQLKDNQDETLSQVLKEKKSLEVQLDEVSSQLLIMKEKAKENEKTDVLKIQSYEEEISKLKAELELRKASEEEISKLKNELELRKASEEEISNLKNELELRKASEEEISKLKAELELRKASEEEISKLKNELELRKASEEEISNLKNELELRKASEEEISNLKKELELRKASEEEISKLKNELELRKASEEEIFKLKNELELRKASEEEISNLKKELELRKASEEEISNLTNELELRKASEEEMSKLKNELELRKASEEEISKLTKELELRKASEEEISKLTKELELRKASEEEVSKLKKELELRKATINELEELSRARELEIANLILHSPVTSDEVDKEFEFSGKPEDKIEQLEIEIAKYKKKIMELEEEAEDKFEITLCQKCEDGETREQIITKAKVLMEKVENDCTEKVEDLTKKLEKSDEMFKKQTTVTKDLEEKLSKVETELKKEMNRSMELSKFNKHLDINRNVLQVVNTETQTLDEKLVEEKKQEISKKDSDISKKNSDISKKDSDISKKDSEISKKDSDISKKDSEISKKNSEVSEKNSEISEKNSEISEKDSEICQKDSQISKITNENEQMRALVETLKKKLCQGEKKYEQLTIRAMDQKSNYESEIQLMQKEIEALIQENKDQENKRKISETILQEKIEELQTVMAESSSKHREEIARLNEIIQEKERCLEDLKKKQQAVENSRKEINTNIENLKKQFEEKERELLSEIRERTASFEHERNEILENSLQEKEELQTRINDLEKQGKDSNIWLKSDEESEISYSTSNENRHRTEAKEMSLSDQDRLTPPQDLSMERPWPADQQRSLKSMKEHDWINRDNRERTRDEYQEHTSSLLEDRPRYDRILEDKREYNGILGDNEGYEGIMEDKRRYNGIWEDKRRYEGILEDKTGYTGITENNKEESLEYYTNRYKERELENEKYQMEIELLVEKEEKERLKEELGTMTTCVDVFHDECQHLKSSLDKALNMIKIIKQERDDLVEQSHQSLDEHSEIMLELIKYEEIIKKLESGNEKLETEKEMLEQYLVQNGDKMMTTFSKTASEHEYSTKSNPEIQRTFLPQNDEVKYSRIARNNEYFTKPNREIQTPFRAKNDNVKDLEDTKIKTEIQEIDFLMKELEKELETREGPSNDDEDHLATLAGYKNKLQEKPVKASMLNTLSFASEKDWEQVERTNDQRRNERERKNDSSFLQTRLSGYQSHEDKATHHNQRVTAQQSLPQELKYAALSRRENDFLLEDHPGPQSDNYTPRFPWRHQDSTTSRKHVTFTRDEHWRTPEQNKDVMSSSPGSMKVDRNQFPSKSTHAKRQLPTEKYREKNVKKKNFVKKNGPKMSEKSQIGEADKLSRSSSRDSSRIVRKMTTTPFTSISQNSENASTISSSFLTSTRTNSALRLVPNLSGLSPIVSELERRRHEELLKWQVADHLPHDPSFDDVDTTILTTADPFGYQQARTPPNFERSSYGNTASFVQKTKQKSRKRSEKHVRSRSADDRSFRSPNKLSSFNSRDDCYAEKPLTINFEDYVIRHRVKSSEDVANLRDPSPAELWLY